MKGNRKVMEMNTDREWLRKKAEQEDGCSVSVGGAVPPTDAAPSPGVTITPVTPVTPVDIEAAYTLKGFNKNPPNIGPQRSLQSINVTELPLESNIENPIRRPPTTEERLREIMAQQSTSLSLDEAAMKNSYLGMDQGSEECGETSAFPKFPKPHIHPIQEEEPERYITLSNHKRITLCLGIVIVLLFIFASYNKVQLNKVKATITEKNSEINNLYDYIQKQSLANMELAKQIVKNEANDKYSKFNNCEVLTSARSFAGNGYFLFCENIIPKEPSNDIKE